MKQFLSKHKTAILYVVLFVALLLMHFSMSLHFGDDVFFTDVDITHLGDFLSMRYKDWTSRVLIEAVLVTICDLPDIVWRILDSLMILWIIRSLSYLFTKNDFKGNFICAVLVMLFPFGTLSTAGWFATTINYSWPLAFGLFALIPIKNVYLEKKERWFSYPLYSLSLIFACNQEQMCALILGFYLLFLIYFLIKRKKADIFMIIQLIFAISSLIFIMTCKGNTLRTQSELSYPEFPNLNLFEKLLVAINSTFSICMTRVNVPLYLFVIMLPVMLRKSKLYVKILSYIPAILVTYLSIGSLLMPYVGFLNNLPVLSLVVSFSKNSPAISAPAIVLCFINLLALALILFLLYHVGREVKSRELSWFLPLLFLAGFMSRLVVGLSPTVIESGIRTFAYFTACLIIIICLVVVRLSTKPDTPEPSAQQ